MNKLQELAKNTGVLNIRKGDESIVKGIDDNDRWRVAYLRLISDVWEGEVKDVESMTHLQIRELFLRRYNYHVPQNLRITIGEYKGKESFVSNATSDENGWEAVFKEKEMREFSYEGEQKEGEEHAFHSAVEMMIPPKPEKNAVSAITNFMAAGKAYPFTCM